VTAANVKDTIKWTLYITYRAVHIAMFIGIETPPPAKFMVWAALQFMG